MIPRALVVGFLLAAVCSAEQIPRAIQVAEPPSALGLDGADRVISSTRQFRITGGDGTDRATIAVQAEEAKNELLRLTGEQQLPGDTKYEWKVPVAVVLHGKSGDPMPNRTIVTRIQFSEAGYSLRLDVHLSRGIEHERFKAAVTSALVLERALRDRPPQESETRFFVPPWLTDGLREATAWRLDQSDRRLYEALFKSGGLFKTEDLFSTDEQRFDDLDGAMRAAFRVSSGSLVMALLQQPQGAEGFRNFLTEVPDFEGEMPGLLRKHFPELNLSETSLSKWWALQLANIGGQKLATDIMTVSRTETALNEALRLNFRTQEGIIQQKEIGAWQEVAALPEPERVRAVQLAQDSLVRLSYRCFPSYRPILAEYQTVLAALVKNQTKDIAARLTDLGERRVTMTAKAERANDYLNWFEITRARQTSGVFDDYMRLKERLKANPRRRGDDMSKYLDRLDAIFSRGLEDPQQPGSLEGEFGDLPLLTPDVPALPPLPSP